MKTNNLKKHLPGLMIVVGFLLSMTGAISMASAQGWGNLGAQLLGYSAGAPSMGAPDASTSTGSTTSTDQTGGTTTPWNTVPPNFIQGLPPKPAVTTGGILIYANGYAGSITVLSGSDVNLIWMPQGVGPTVSDCTVSWDAANPSRKTGNQYRNEETIHTVTQTTVYGVTCGAYSGSVNVNVVAKDTPITVSLKINGQHDTLTIPWQTSITETWTANYPDLAKNCITSHSSPYPDYNVSDVVMPGQRTEILTTAGTYRYLLVCSGPRGEALQDSVTVNLQSKTDNYQPPAATNFTQPSLDSLTLGPSDVVKLWANSSLDSVAVPYGSKVWLSWKANSAAYPDIFCKTAPGGSNFQQTWSSCDQTLQTCPVWNGNTVQPTGQVQIGPITVNSEYNLECNYTVNGIAQTASSKVTIIVPPNPNTFDFDFSVNGQAYNPNDAKAIDENLNELGFPLGTPLDVVWKANDPTAVCNVLESPIWGSDTKNLPASGEKVITVDSNTPQSEFASVDRVFGGGTVNIRMDCTAGGQYKGKRFWIFLNAPRPSAWTVSLNGNGQSGTVTVPSGTSVILSWNTNYPSDFVYGHGAQGGILCTASGDWSGRKDGLSGQESTGPITYNKSYTLQCGDPNTHSYDAKGSLTVLVGGSSTTNTTTDNLNGPGMVNGVPCQDKSNTTGLIVWTKSCDYLRALQQAQSTSTGNSSSTTTQTGGTNVPPAGFEDQVKTSYDQNPFADTDLGNVCGTAAAELYGRAVIGGFSDGTFRSSELVNRAQAAKFLLLTRLSTVEDQTGNAFHDVLSGQWYTKFVLKAAKLGVIKGYKDGTFKPANPVNTAEFLKMMTLTFGLETNLPYSYTDVKATDWFATYAGIAQKYNLFPQEASACSGSGAAYSETLLNPGRNLSRGDVAVAIYQYLKNR